MTWRFTWRLGGAAERRRSGRSTMMLIIAKSTVEWVMEFFARLFVCARIWCYAPINSTIEVDVYARGPRVRGWKTNGGPHVRFVANFAAP
ncbi:hypothetical protein HMPREF9207_0099 [Cutibacterium acnes J165]|nr:hypothetical protein HMPREF9207_0099 [Cutibacterium acnes J165]